MVGGGGVQVVHSTPYMLPSSEPLGGIAMNPVHAALNPNAVNAGECVHKVSPLQCKVLKNMQYGNQVPTWCPPILLFFAAALIQHSKVPCFDYL